MSLTPILILHTADRSAEDVRAEAATVLEAWPTRKPPPLHCATVQQVLDGPAVLREAGVVWIRIEAISESDLFELIDLVQEQNLPAMVTQQGDAHTPGAPIHDGVIACPPTTEATTTCAILAALHSQVMTLAAMRAELKLLRLHQAGIADQIDKIDEELRLAAQLQREFLPTKLPQLDTLVFDVMWRPAGYVSGDIYDVERLDEEHIGMFLADAVGHGVPAALLTVYIKRSLQTKHIGVDGSYRIVPPGEALDKLNRDMVAQQSGKVRFATAAYVVINMRTLVAQVARAGHPFPMLLRSDGSTEMIEADGGLLGVFDEQEFEQTEVQLQPNDRLLLYSDGFELAFPEAEPEQSGKPQFATEQYADEFQALREGSLDGALERLGNLLDIQAGSLNQRDDLTVLGVSVSGDAVVAAQEVAHAAN